MPITIREIVVNSTITEGQEDTNRTSGNGKIGREDMEKIIAACVEEVLKLLKEKEER